MLKFHLLQEHENVKLGLARKKGINSNVLNVYLLLVLAVASSRVPGALSPGVTVGVKWVSLSQEQHCVTGQEGRCQK